MGGKEKLLSLCILLLNDLHYLCMSLPSSRLCFYNIVFVGANLTGIVLLTLQFHCFPLSD